LMVKYRVEAAQRKIQKKEQKQYRLAAMRDATLGAVPARGPSRWSVLKTKAWRICQIAFLPEVRPISMIVFMGPGMLNGWWFSRFPIMVGSPQDVGYVYAAFNACVIIGGAISGNLYD